MKIPRATYRLQFNRDFTFKQAREILGYLSDLGISDMYASPILKAGQGSTHCYDAIDFHKINPEIGKDDDFEGLISEVIVAGMGWLQDFVPNHMAYLGENPMLIDLFENGQASPFFDYFDIEWDSPFENMKGKVLAPFLGEFYEHCLEKGEIKLTYTQDGFVVEYFDFRLPLKPESYATLLTCNLSSLKKNLGSDHPDFYKYLGLLYVMRNLPSSREQIEERRDQIRFIKIGLWELYTKNNTVRRFINKNIKTCNGMKGQPESFELLDDLLTEQMFKLSFWKVATEEVNYRRFFTVNGLICLRMQNEQVFADTHSFIQKLIDEKKITGLRIDHIDGLYDPTAYLKSIRLRAEDIYLIVEKILDLKENLPNFWPIQGTTGYDFMNYVNELFCYRKNEKKFNKIYHTFLGRRIGYEDLVYMKKRLLIDKHMIGDVDRLARLIKKITGGQRHGGDITLYGLKNALVVILELFPIYRTYVTPETFSPSDRAYIHETMKKAKGLRPDLIYELNFLQEFLLLQFQDYFTEEEKRKWIDFVMRFQQQTGPLMAKGVEDTTFYIYNRLVSLNEVGGCPDTFGISTEDFHEFNTKRSRFWPHTMNATSTHDTKRGEDVRARIHVLSEIPEQWEDNLKKWARMNQGKKRVTQGMAAPDENDEYFLYQTLIGVFPFEEKLDDDFVERIKEYMIKAIREAKVHTDWIKPDTAYEKRVVSFIERILEKSDQNSFLKDFLPFQKKVAHYGLFNSLSQTLLKISSPGVPDFYRGTELWELNLVDPDNRRPVDFIKRQNFLKEIRQQEKENVSKLLKNLLLTRKEGKIKLFLIYRALQARAERQDLFENGDYVPLQVEGKHKDQIVAFSRNKENFSSITVVPRFLTSLIKEDELPLGDKIWDDTQIVAPQVDTKKWKNIFTGQLIENKEKILISELLKDFPVTLLFNHR